MTGGGIPRLGLLELDGPDEAISAALARIPSETGLILFGHQSALKIGPIVRTLFETGAHVLEYIALPPFDSDESAAKYARESLLLRVETLANALPPEPAPPRASQTMHAGSFPRPANRDRSRLSARFDICAIGISAGGPRALAELLEKLPGGLNGSILIAQHMPEGFTAQLAQGLNWRTELEVVEARDGMLVERGHVFIAPGGRHMTVERRADRIYLRVRPGPLHNYCQPSIDLLFDSLVDVIPTRTLAILMTGMGSDGCEGLRRLKAARAYSMAQSEKSCTIFGIPARAIDAGLIDEVLDIDGLADRIIAYLGVYQSEPARLKEK